MKNDILLKIDLPGAKITFLIEDLSEKQIINKILEQTFFPYAIMLSKRDTILSSYIHIKTDGYILNIRKQIERCTNITMQMNSIFETFKIILTIIRENFLITDDYCYLHGSATIFQGYPCLFLAETGTGKSTLSVHWDLNNHMCLTDDLIILEKKYYKICPISRYANIREAGVSLLGKKSCYLQYNELTRRYEYLLSPKRFHKEHNIKHIFILHRGCPQPKICLANNPFDSISHNAYLPYQIKNNVLSSLKISNDYPIYDVFYNTFDEITHCLKEFVK